MLLTIAILIVVVPAGLMLAVIALVRAGIAREESDGSLLRKPPTHAAALTRRIVGMHGVSVSR
jgi:hypothetical protein